MFGGLTKTSSRIAIAAALGMTLGGFAINASPAKAADLGGDCVADLEERVAELEATTVRKGNKKVSVTLPGWVVKLGSWWDDGHETNFYVGDKDTTLSSRFQISGSAQISPGWSAGYAVVVDTTQPEPPRSVSARTSSTTKLTAVVSATSTRSCPICRSRATYGARSTGVS